MRPRRPPGRDVAGDDFHVAQADRGHRQPRTLHGRQAGIDADYPPGLPGQLRQVQQAAQGAAATVDHRPARLDARPAQRGRVGTLTSPRPPAAVEILDRCHREGSDGHAAERCQPLPSCIRWSAREETDESSGSPIAGVRRGPLTRAGFSAAWRVTGGIETTLPVGSVLTAELQSKSGQHPVQTLELIAKSTFSGPFSAAFARTGQVQLKIAKSGLGGERPCEVRAYLACRSWDGAGAGENLLRRPAAARTIGRYRRKAQRSDVRVTAIPPGRRAGARRAGVRRRAAALVGLPAGHGHYAAGEQGTNNRTFLVRHGQQRYVLRVSGFLSVAEVRAEHRILQRLRQGGLPFQVPEPVAAPDGRTVIGTPAGPAAVCRWLPGARPGMDGEAAFERFGRAAGLLGAALADVPLADALRDWRTDPRWVRLDDPPVDVLCGELRSAA